MHSSASYLQIDNIAEESTAFLNSAFESILSLKPMFDLKPIISTKTNSTKNYTHIFGFESLFESQEYVDNIGKWMQHNWHLSIAISFFYVTLVGLGNVWMRSRVKYELRFFLIIWNLFLAVFSITGAIRSFPEFYYALTQHGIVYSICDGSYAYGITGFWAFMFIMSKVPELVDTLFIILRKQRLIFLHWYHHATVLCYCWFSYKDFASNGRWFMNMNYIVHGLMYSYYACKALKIRVPMFISQLITTLQIVQMIGGCYVNWVAYQTKVYTPNIECKVSFENIYASMIMYLSYFALFFNFFLHVYVFRSSKKTNDDTASKKVLSINLKDQHSSNSATENTMSKKVKKTN